jgi:hypothetical protein
VPQKAINKQVVAIITRMAHFAGVVHGAEKAQAKALS